MLVVAGGFDETIEDITSTEVLEVFNSASTWTITSPLPRTLVRPGAALMGNLYFMGESVMILTVILNYSTGGEISDDNYSDGILKWVDGWNEGELGKWLEVGKMKVARAGDAAIIQRDHPEMKYCTFVHE